MTHILQSKEWGEFRKQTPNIKKVIRQNGQQVFFSKIPFGTVAYLPRVDAPANLDEQLSICKKEHAVFLKIEPLCPFSFLNSQIGKSILPRHTIHVDLTKSEDQILVGMHEKTRYNIRLAQKKGVIVKEENNPENFIKLLESTEKRQGFYSHDPDYYRLLWKTLRPSKMVYVLSGYRQMTSDELPISSVMLFSYDGFLYYPYGGSDPKYRDFQAPSLLHFEAIKLGKKLGLKTYDLWGSYKFTPDEKDPWWGIYRFKKGFGGKEITFPESIDIPLSPLYNPLLFAETIRWKILKLIRN